MGQFARNESPDNKFLPAIDAADKARTPHGLWARVAFNVNEHPHLDHGYAVTSHSSQEQTADRVLIHVDTEQAGEKLVNRRLAYVALSRGRYDAQLYTNDKGHLTAQLSRDVSHRSAMESSRASASSAHEIKPSSARSQVHEHTQAEGHSISR